MKYFIYRTITICIDGYNLKYQCYYVKLRAENGNATEYLYFDSFGRMLDPETAGVC